MTMQNTAMLMARASPNSEPVMLGLLDRGRRGGGEGGEGGGKGEGIGGGGEKGGKGDVGVEL